MSFRLLVVICPLEKWVGRGGHPRCPGSHGSQMSSGLCVFLGVGALRWRAAKCFSRHLQVRLEREPGGELCRWCGGGCHSLVNTVWTDHQEPFGDLKLSFHDGLRAYLQMCQSCSEGVLQASRWLGEWLPFSVCDSSVPVPSTITYLPRTGVVGMWGKEAPALSWVSQPNIYQKQGCRGKVPGPR